MDDIGVRDPIQELRVPHERLRHEPAGIAAVDEFHVRGAEVTRELASQIKLDNLRVLDVGCGLGGPSRMLADEFGCRVTGIDLNDEYIRTATGLSELVESSFYRLFRV